MTPPASPRPHHDQLLDLADQLDNLHAQLEMSAAPEQRTTELTPPHLPPGVAGIDGDPAALVEPSARHPRTHWFWPRHDADACDRCRTHDGLPGAGSPGVDLADAASDQVEAVAARVLADGARRSWQQLADELAELQPPEDGSGTVDPADRALAISLATSALPRARDRAAELDRLAHLADEHAHRSRARVAAGWPDLDDPAPPRLPRHSDRRRDLVVEALTLAGPVLDTATLLEVVAVYRGVELTGNDISWLPRDDTRRRGTRITRALDGDGAEIPGTWVLHDPDATAPLGTPIDHRPHHGRHLRWHQRRTAASLAGDALDAPHGSVCDPERLRSLALRLAADALGADPPDGPREAVTVWLARAWQHLLTDPWSPGSRHTSQTG